MQKQLVATFIIILMPFLFVSCVSSLFKDKAPTFSREIRLRAPEAPFKETDTSVYPSWKSSASGNVISIVSDCSQISSYSLSSLHQLIENSLQNVHTVKEEQVSIQGRPSLSKVIEGELDGFPIEVRSVSFMKKSCGYVGSLSGKKGSLDGDQAEFDRFLNNMSFE